MARKLPNVFHSLYRLSHDAPQPVVASALAL
jgi:hypothetical protein